MSYLSEDNRKRLIEAGFPEEKLGDGDAETVLRGLPMLNIEITNNGDYYCVTWKKENWLGRIVTGYDSVEDTLANAAAELFIHLKTNNLL